MLQQGSPPLFRRGAPAELRAAVLVIAALAFMIIDSQSRILDPMRRVVSMAIYPFQRVVLAPRDAVQLVSEWVDAAQMIRNENEALQRQRIELAQVLSHGVQLDAENAQLRRLLGIVSTVAQPTVVVQVLYEPASPYVQRLIFNKGSAAGIEAGMPVIDEGGVVGQIVRVTPSTAEAALVTDEQISIPVQLSRNGLRLIAFGSNTPGKMEARYLTANADIKEGDTLVTSGVGGLFPAGLPVAKVISVERNTASGFARALGEPLAHPERYRHFLVLQTNVAQSESRRQEANVDESR